MIELKNIRKTYMLGGETVNAVDGLSLVIDEHEFVAIVGASGSGKSTLMNIIGCLDSADEGEYLLRGQDISSFSSREMAVLRNREIGFVFQQLNLLQKLTALENVELPLIYQRMHVNERKERAQRALDRVGLSDRSSHKPAELSGGQQQRVAIARALATNPAILLADEPTGNLDSKTGDDIIALFHELHQAGDTIVLITHNEEIAKQAQRRIRIMDGRVTEVSA